MKSRKQAHRLAPRRAARTGVAEAGFTLIEILVALAVLAIALAAAVRAVGQSLDSAAALRDRTLAQWVAEDRLTRHEINRSWPALDTYDGEAEIGGRRFRWQEQVSATPVARLRRIDVRVFEPAGEAALVRLSGFVSQTGQSP